MFRGDPTAPSGSCGSFRDAPETMVWGGIG